ncbi:spore germination protein [Terrilactibacillus sp. BCM23-1]|uniref:Spore germination protein n=1 Tax=Terrilactibacillus tamarindi TaxID=2599694 RepID=A0A6N8CU36_9BACI|nr:spore germination protein [Terrilactibacillus tamarindi]MTT32623.1 spore germination protein [Terrilactibacillus tamarindi]
MDNQLKKQVEINIEENIVYLKHELGVGKNFDVIHLDVEYAEKKMAMFLVDGLINDNLLHLLLKFLAKVKKEELKGNTLKKLLRSEIPHVEVSSNDDLNQVVDIILTGQTALLVDGINEVIVIDARTYPVRGPEEPDTERVVRGARDGFVETIVFNTALTRRRIRDRTLRMEFLQLGRRSKTDIVICYIGDIADPEMVHKLKEILSDIDTDGLPMAEKTIDEYISGGYWNPFPVVRFTERPDTTAAHLFEGHICIFVDGSPSVMITPVTYWHHLQHAEEYRNKPLTGAYLRFVRYIAVFASIFIMPLWYLLNLEPGLIPDQFDFIGPNDKGQVPLLLQFLLVEVGMDMLRMAAIHTPTALATALGLVAALMIGQVAVQVGLFTNEVILYFSIAAIGTFATPSYELGLANRLVRIVLLLSTALFHTPGYVIASTIFIILLARMQSFGVPYLWPFIPFNYKAFRDILVRAPMPLRNRRPRILKPKDPDR